MSTIFYFVAGSVDPGFVSLGCDKAIMVAYEVNMKTLELHCVVGSRRKLNLVFLIQSHERSGDSKLRGMV